MLPTSFFADLLGSREGETHGGTAAPGFPALSPFTIVALAAILYTTFRPDE